MANISGVHKKGDKHLPENYRPISLTSVISKIGAKKTSTVYKAV